MTIEHQKQVVDEILAKLFPIDPYAIVAGGAPRDWYFGKEAADIDVFFHNNTTNWYTLDSMLSSVGIKWDTRKCGHLIPEHYKMNPLLRGVYGLEVKGVAVQIMAMDKPTFVSVVPKFPLSICHVWYKDGKTRSEKPFLRSIKHNAIYKTNTVYNDEHAYIQKILTKFPEYEYFDSAGEFAESVLDNYLVA